MHFLLRSMCTVILLLLASLAAGPSVAQTFSLGADIMSRYIWRGTDFGESASIQPALSFSAGGFEIGAWASYAISPVAADVNENDLWAGYTVETENAGSFSFGVTDYYFPSPGGTGFFDYSGDGEGAHWIEPYASYTGPDSFPLTLFGAMFVHNDPDNSLYLEASLPVKVDGVMLGLTAGAVGGESAFYGTDGFAVVNLGLAATKDLKLNESFALPVSIAYILNPDTERSFLVLGLGFSL